MGDDLVKIPLPGKFQCIKPNSKETKRGMNLKFTEKGRQL
jgi:hypothetical protein